MTSASNRRNLLGIDKMDQRILCTLQTDARMGDVTLAQSIHLSPSAVGRRVRMLRERGVILSSQLVLDPVQLGLTTTVLTLVQLDQHDPKALTAFEQYLDDRMPFVVEVVPLLGSWDYLLRVVAFDNIHYGQLKEQIASQEGVVRARSLTAVGPGKTRPLPIAELLFGPVGADGAVGFA
jgi:Lrp/AsnC family transcriptional regulator, leucine-responsive regulatory protein